jgi:pimeloyl-ACP methyl ester carboxylesterase
MDMREGDLSERGGQSLGERIRSDQPAAIRPLARFGGVRPPAPVWFEAALSDAPERSSVDVDGAAIEMLCWGRRGTPGLILLHGTNAHADWWSFIAPALAAERRVIAFSLSGMGRSAWREHYSVAGYAREVIAVAEAGGAFAGAEPPVALGHSFGGLIVAEAMASAGERFAGAVLVDSILLPPGQAVTDLGMGRSFNPVIASLADAVARFRVLPPQDVENLYALDHIARRSIKPVPGGVTWSFDPTLISKLRDIPDGTAVARMRTSVALMRGDRSSLASGPMYAYARGLVDRAVPEVVIPDAGHHVMIDQPLAFIAALRGLLAAWPTAPA